MEPSENMDVNQGIVDPSDSAKATSREENSQTISLNVLEEERQKRQQLEEQVKAMQAQFAMLRHQETAEPTSQLHDDDVVTAGDLKKVLDQQNQMMAEVQMQQQYPDYAQVITRFLPQALKEDPSLRASLERNRDPKAAYYIAKGSSAYRKTLNQPSVKERIEENTQKPGALASMGSVGVQQGEYGKGRLRSDQEILEEFNKLVFG